MAVIGVWEMGVSMYSVSGECVCGYVWAGCKGVKGVWEVNVDGEVQMSWGNMGGKSEKEKLWGVWAQAGGLGVKEDFGCEC